MFATLSAWADERQACDGVCAGNWTRDEKKQNFHVKRRNLAQKLMGHFNLETSLASAPRSATRRADIEVQAANNAMV
jgi:hypothetical protein